MSVILKPGGIPFEEGEILTNWMRSRFAANKNVLMAIIGQTGCLAGDTIINTSRNELGRKYPIKWLYNAFHGLKNKGGRKWDLKKPTFVRSFDGKIIKLNKIKDILYSGKQEIYKLTLENGLSLKATVNHQIMTRNGWIPLRELAKEEVMCDVLKANISFRKRIRLREIENLKFIKKEEHMKFEHNLYTNFSQGIPKFSKVLSIKKIGIEDVYDIECEESPNFVANGIVVHNSGKSYTSMRLAELWYQRFFKEEFPIENVCFSIKELALRLRDGNLKKGSMLVFEEAGVNVNALEFQSKISRIFSHVMQSFRSKNIGIIFNLPSLGFLNKTARVLLHAMCQTMTIDRNKNEVIVSPYVMQFNSMMDKVYTKHFRVLNRSRQLVPVQEIGIKLPTIKLIEQYEMKKSQFVGDVLNKLIVEGEPEKKEKKENTEFYEQIKKLWLQGYKKTGEIAAHMGVGTRALNKRGISDIIMRLCEEYPKNISKKSMH